MLEDLQLIKNNLIQQRNSIFQKKGTLEDVIDNIDDIWDNYREIYDDNETPGDALFWVTTNPDFFEQTGNSVDRTAVWIKTEWYRWRIDKGYDPNESPSSNKKLVNCLEGNYGNSYDGNAYAQRDHPYPDKSQRWWASHKCDAKSDWSRSGSPSWVESKLAEYTKELKNLVNQKKGDLTKQYILDH